MVAGHLREKNGYFHIILNYKDEYGKRQTKSIGTGLPIKGNKKRAEQMLMDARRSFTPAEQVDASEISFADWLERWLVHMEDKIEASTYSSYVFAMRASTIPYFRKLNVEGKPVTVQNLKPAHIQEYYAWELRERKVKANTVVHKHANIRKALEWAVQLELIQANPSIRVELPRKEKYAASTYNEQELEQLFRLVKGTKIEFAVIAGAFYGLRRSEVIGLKWDAIDFEKKTITIKHTVTQVTLDGKYTLVAKDKAKNKSSLRTLPLVKPFEELLLRMKADQELYREVCGNCYSNEYEGYIYVNELGILIRPGYVSQHFKILQDNNGLRKIRFHDLRHSCASLLYANGVSILEISQWLGHSDIATTTNIYTHLDFNTKVAAASAIEGVLFESA